MNLLQRFARSFWELAHALDGIQVRRGRKRTLAELEASRPALSGMTVGAHMAVTDDAGKAIAIIWPDGTVEVFQPDKIRACGDALVERLAAEAARAAAEKEFGSAP